MSRRPDLVECWIFRLAESRPPAGGFEVLLIRRSPGRIFPGLWQCVTGGLEPGETVPLAALREVREETGLGPADIEGFFDLDLVADFYDGGVDGILSSAIFAVRVGAAAEVRLSEEHDDHRWVGPTDAVRLAVWPSYGEALRRIGERLLDPELARWFALDPGDGRRLAR